MKKPLFFFLADDDEDDRFFFLEALKEIDPGIECMVASNGKDALALLQNDFFSLPDYIFLDLNMPLMDGLKCLEEIKRIPSLSHIPVIIYSTSSEKEVAASCMKAGAYAFFIKPSSSSDLLNYLRKLIAG